MPKWRRCPCGSGALEWRRWREMTKPLGFVSGVSRERLASILLSHEGPGERVVVHELMNWDLRHWRRRGATTRVSCGRFRGILLFLTHPTPSYPVPFSWIMLDACWLDAQLKRGGCMSSWMTRALVHHPRMSKSLESYPAFSRQFLGWTLIGNIMCCVRAGWSRRSLGMHALAIPPVSDSGWYRQLH